MKPPDFINSLFKNQVENAAIKLHAIDKRNWPSFLYPEGTTYDESELDKGLFRGHVFLRVCLSLSLNAFHSHLQFFRVYVLSSLGNLLPLMVIDLLPSPHRQRCMACEKYSQKPWDMLLSK